MENRVITPDQSQALNKILSGMLSQSGADGIFICNTGGYIIEEMSVAENDANATIAALAAGSFAATSELAKYVGEPAFRAVYHRGEKESIYIQGIGRYYLILVLFGRNTTIGLVRLYIEKSINDIDRILKEIEATSTSSSPMR